MRLYLDTEFNGHGGELISLALVAEDGSEWYGVCPLPANPHPWVQENVLGKLAIDLHRGLPLTMSLFMEGFATFLYQFPDAEIVADWPADFEHLCRLVSWNGSENGWRIPINFTMRLIDREGSYNSEIEHNALSDARALRDWCRDWLRAP